MNKNQTIIAIVGASGSGKTTLSMLLNRMYNIPALCSYTTRPMRDGEVNGVDHWFVDMSYPIPRDPLAYTFFGNNHYWTEVSQVNAPIVSYVVDEVGLLELREKWSHRFNIYAVQVIRPDNPTEKSRVDRDKVRIQLPDTAFDYILLNDGSEAELAIRCAELRLMLYAENLTG